jgi:hypothetical protein
LEADKKQNESRGRLKTCLNQYFRFKA